MSKKIKKIIPYCLILIILFGIFSGVARVNAQDANDPDFVGPPAPTPPVVPPVAPAPPGAPTAPIDNTLQNKTGLYANLSCVNLKTFSIDVGGCLGTLFYFILVKIPEFLLSISGMLFNALIAIGLNSDLFHAVFVEEAWAVVRDFANIFFILILLYVAIQTILGLGHETKKIIVKVVIMALLINFSMFFTKIVVDSSNILALVFYNKITGGNTVRTTNLSEEKDVSSRLAGAFNPTLLLSAEFFKAAEKRKDVTPPTLRGTLIAKALGVELLYFGQKVVGYVSPSSSIPIEITLGIEVVSALIMFVAIYCFFVVGLMFLSRLIELWVLIIFSPFAFMSFALPKLASAPYIGWEEWSKRLLKLSFMAPIFMFFLYLIFMLVNANLFSSLMRDSKNPTTWETILFIIIPAMVILILLLKSTKYAEEASGELGAAMLKGAKVVGGLAVTATAAAVSGGTSLAVGSLAAKAASSKGLQAAAKGTGFKGIASRMALRTADYGTKASFDVRGIPGIGSLAKAGGLNLGTAREGGYEKMRADKVKKRQERAKQLEVREDEGLKQNLNNVERDLQDLLRDKSHKLEMLDKQIKSAREGAQDTERTLRLDRNNPLKIEAAKEASDKLQDLRAEKKSIKDAKLITSVTGKIFDGDKAENKSKLGYSINKLEDEIISHAKDEIERENRDRKWAFAGRMEASDGSKVSKIMFWRKTRTNREAGHKIRMEAKLDSGTKEGSH